MNEEQKTSKAEIIILLAGYVAIFGAGVLRRDNLQMAILRKQKRARPEFHSDRALLNLPPESSLCTY